MPVYNFFKWVDHCISRGTVAKALTLTGES